MRLPTKLQVFVNFLHKKIYNPLSPPYSPDISSPDYILFPTLKMKFKGPHFADVAEIQEAVTDELKEVQKEEFSAAFRNCTTSQKPVYMPMELILTKKRYHLPHVSLVFKKNKSYNF
jgi:hypothetical protein